MAGSQIKQPQYSLESVAIFRGLSSPALERIKLRCSCRRYEPRESIVGHLDTSDEVFFLLTGSARVTVRSADGKAVNFRELSSGGMFGEYAAIDGRPGRPTSKQERVASWSQCRLTPSASSWRRSRR